LPCSPVVLGSGSAASRCASCCCRRLERRACRSDRATAALHLPRRLARAWVSPPSALLGLACVETLRFARNYEVRRLREVRCRSCAIGSPSGGLRYHDRLNRQCVCGLARVTRAGRVYLGWVSSRRFLARCLLRRDRMCFITVAHARLPCVASRLGLVFISSAERALWRTGSGVFGAVDPRGRSGGVGRALGQ